LRHIQKGGKVVIFPEGGIATDGPLPVQPGAAALWVRSGAPLIPLRYSGAEDWRLAPGGRQWFPRITLEIGDPIPAPALIEDAVRRIEREIFTPPAMCLGDLSLQTRRLGF
jgi:1-acyl-sn-glycerol-3-phosphate acyltransferase